MPASLFVAAADVGRTPARQRSKRAVLVGRDRELRALHDDLERVRLDGARGAFVTGPPGIGKTALLERFCAELPEEVELLSSRCRENEFVPYNALDGIIDGLAHSLDPQHFGDLVLSELERHAALVVFPALGTLLELPAPKPRPLSLHALRRIAFAVLSKLLASVATRAALVLLIEDLQWADLDSQRALVELLRGLR